MLFYGILSIFLGLSLTLGFKAASFDAEVEKNELDLGGTEKNEEPFRGYVFELVKYFLPIYPELAIFSLTIKSSIGIN